MLSENVPHVGALTDISPLLEPLPDKTLLRLQYLWWLGKMPKHTLKKKEETFAKVQKLQRQGLWRAKCNTRVDIETLFLSSHTAGESLPTAFSSLHNPHIRNAQTKTRSIGKEQTLNIPTEHSQSAENHRKFGICHLKTGRKSFRFFC